MTALHLISSHLMEKPRSNETLIQVCIENGANPNVQDIVITMS